MNWDYHMCVGIRLRLFDLSVYLLVCQFVVRLRGFTVDLRSTVHFYDVALLFTLLLTCFVTMVTKLFLSSPIQGILVLFFPSSVCLCLSLPLPHIGFTVARNVDEHGIFQPVDSMALSF